MASISSLSGSSSSSSIYGSRNILSGLGSGLDTESMIENAVSGYQLKLATLQQKKTKVEWKQEAYRSMITKLVGFSQKYTSYTSGTNLLSASFFDNATKVTSVGKNASKVSAVGRTDSDVQITSVERLASAAKYSASTINTLSANHAATKAVELFHTDGEDNVTESMMDVGLLKGSMTLSYGGKNMTLSFSESDVFTSAQEMADAINKRLENETIAFNNGKQEKASDLIKAEVKDGEIVLNTVEEGDGNGIKISRVSGNLGEKLGIGEIKDDEPISSFSFDKAKVSEQKSALEVLSKSEFTITLNGKTETIKAPTADDMQEYLDKKNEANGTDISEWDANDYAAALQEKINAEFGEGAFTVTNAGDAQNLKLSFTTSNSATDDFKVVASKDKLFGMEGGLSNKVNLSRTLKDILGDPADDANKDNPWGDATTTKDEDGKEIVTYKFEINENSSIDVTEDMTLQELMDKLNSDENSDVKMSYSSFSNSITFTSKQTGANEKIKFKGLSAKLFGESVDAERNAVTGKNSKFKVKVNEGAEQEIERADNSIDIDGLSITLKGTFGKDVEGSESDDPVTFSFSSDADKIVDAIKGMVEDYNAMMTEVKEAYTTIPLKNSKGEEYMPLTDEDQAEMSESAVTNYEKKAKTGLLFGDRDLSNLYSAMTDALNAFGVSGNDLSGIGITTSYSNGTTTLVVDENALRTALENNPDKVRDVFVGKNGSGGVMEKMKDQLDAYVGTTGANKGILINKAGSTLAPVSIYQNTMQQEIDKFSTEIEKWQDKLSDKIDYYNKKFTALEKLISQMNNQSSALAGLSGGY